MIEISIWGIIIICITFFFLFYHYFDAKAKLIYEEAREKEIENDRKEHEGFEE